VTHLQALLPKNCLAVR